MMWIAFVKLSGACCILLCGTLWGIFRARTVSARVHFMEEMLRFLQCVESELYFRAQETPDLLGHAQAKAQLHYLAFHFQAMTAGPEFPVQMSGEIHAFRQQAAEYGVPASAQDVFTGVLLQLGTIAAGEECRELQYAQEQLRRMWEECRQDAQSRQKVSIAIGAGAGACAALLVL